MQTEIAAAYRGTADGTEAEAILRKCVHCGFCTATCPTYQLLGDELDGPRGRIYLIKQVLEGATPTAATQLHLDRCLSCRNCETTCPSGVQYGRLVDIGRRVVDAQVQRPAAARLLRGALKAGLTSPAFGPALKLGQAVRPLLPATLRGKVPAARPVPAWPTRRHPRKMVLPAGCVQPAMLPGIDVATARAFDALGVELTRSPASGCCGAIREHLGDHAGAQADARRNVDAWWPLLEQGAEAIVINASGCGAMVKDYGHLLRDDPAYAERAGRVAQAARDPAELLPALVEARRTSLAWTGSERPAPRLAFHPPCTLQHGQRIRGAVEGLLAMLGAQVLPFAEAHLCCGSAGTYSVLQPALATALRDRKLGHVLAVAPDAILSANVGCIAHLQSGTDTPVRHWIEWLDERLAPAADGGVPAGAERGAGPHRAGGRSPR